MDETTFREATLERLKAIHEAEGQTARRLGSGEVGYDFRPQTVFGKLHYCEQHLARIQSSAHSGNLACWICAIAVVAVVIHRW